MDQAILYCCRASHLPEPLLHCCDIFQLSIVFCFLAVSLLASRRRSWFIHLIVVSALSRFVPEGVVETGRPIGIVGRTCPSLGAGWVHRSRQWFHSQCDVSASKELPTSVNKGSLLQIPRRSATRLPFSLGMVISRDLQAGSPRRAPNLVRTSVPPRSQTLFFFLWHIKDDVMDNWT